MSALYTRSWTALERRLSDLPPERWLRVRLTADAIERFAGRRRLSVLDAGSGDAPLARLLAAAHPAWEVVAADYDEAGLERAGRAAARAGVSNLDLRHVDLCRPFDDSRYDAVASLEVLTEIEDDDVALRHLAQALRPGGLLVVTSMDRDWTPVLRGSSPTWRLEVRHGYTRAELVAKLEGAGLTVLRARPVFRSAVRLAEEISDRVKGYRLRVRAPLYPILRAAALFERQGLAAGETARLARGGPSAVRRFLAPGADAVVHPGPRPSFSVVIPAYQAAASIGEALESVLVQTAPPLEIIVSDDGSTDGIDNVLEPYRERIMLLRGPHRGVSAARNAALAVARGEFVANLDADDVFLPERLEALGELAMAHSDLDILATDAWFEVDGRRQGRFNRVNGFPVDDQRAGILSTCFVLSPAVRREALLEVGGFDESLARSGGLGLLDPARARRRARRARGRGPVRVPNQGGQPHRGSPTVAAKPRRDARQGRRSP